MKKILLVTVGLAILTGCNEVYRGSFELLREMIIVSDMTVKELNKLQECKDASSTKSSCQRLQKKYDKNVKVLAVGNYEAKVTPSKSEIKMQILNNKGKVAHEFEIKVPKKANLPKSNGTFEIKKAESGFTYDIAGEIKTEITNSDTIRASESCTWTESFEVCDRVLVQIPNCQEDSAQDLSVGGRPDGRGDGLGAGRPGRGGGAPEIGHGPRHGDDRLGGGRCQRFERVCRIETRTYHGYQNVEFYNQYTRKDLAFDLISAVDQGTVGEYSGVFNDTDKIYTFRGVCR